MKFCPNCGSELKEGADICVKCGKIINGNIPVNNQANVQTETSTKTNGLALAGFITALASLLLNFWGIVGLVATILSGVGLSKVNETGEKGKGMAVAGLCIGIFSIIYGIIQIFVLASYF